MALVESEVWLRRMQSGSVEAFDAFYEAYSPYVYKISIQLTRDRLEAEDLCHDVFVEVFHQAGKFDSSRGSVKAWLAIKTRSRFLDRKRKAKRAIEGFDQTLFAVKAWESSLDERLEQKVNQDELLEAINALPEPQKIAVFHKYFKEQTQKEIATSMDKPLGTVKSLIRYGILNMRKSLMARGFFETGSEAKGEGNV